MRFAVSKSPAALISHRCELWAVGSDSHPEKAYQVVVLPDSQALCSCPAHGDCKHIRKVRMERGESAVRFDRKVTA